MVSAAVWLGFRVRGKLAPESENPDPEEVTELIVTDAVPVEESVMVCVETEFTETLPKLTLVALTERVGTAAFN